MIRKSLIVAGLMTGMVGGAADAATFNLEYTLDAGGIMTATVQGTVDPGDANLVNVASVSDAAFDGSSFGPMEYSAFGFGFGDGSGILSFDGSATELVSCFTYRCFDGFIISVFNQSGKPIYNNGGSFGGVGLEDFDTARYSVTEVPAVPLPAAMPLMLVALGGLGFAARRRKAA